MPVPSWPRVFVFGEALTDLVRVGASSWTSVAGGSCWNVARVAATLGVATAWCGAVSDDLFGREILEKSGVAGLDTRFIQLAPKAPLIAVVHQTHPPSYFFLGNDSADLAFDERKLPMGWEESCEIAHFGCISLVRQPLGARLVTIAEHLKTRGVQISFDPNHRNLMGPDYFQLFEHMVRLADIIKISNEDLSGIYPEIANDIALGRVRSLNNQATLLYTRGAETLSMFRGEGRLDQAAFSVEVADSVGAGDACLGGLIASLVDNPQADSAMHLEFAAATAAAACMHVGAYAPSRAEVDRLIAQAEPR